MPLVCKYFFTLSLILLTSCSQIKTSQSDTLNMNLGFEPATLDWNMANDSYSFDIINNLMVGLTRFSTNKNSDLISEPACAVNWEISEDATEYIFHLDPRAKWTDGVPVTAQHFIDSFKRIADPQTAAPYADLLSMIDLEKSSAINNHTLKITLKYPAAYFIFLTSYGLTLPIRLDLIQAHSDKWTEPANLVTNGAFKLKKWQHEYKIVLEKNDDFHLATDGPNQPRYLKFFMVPEQSSAFTLFKNKQFDWIDGRSIPNSEFHRLKNTKDDHLNFPLLRNTFIGFNLKKKPFDDKRVRKAFSYSINREDLVKVLARGYKANATWIPPGLNTYYDENKGLDYHPDTARELLSAAGYPNGHGFPNVEFLFPSTEESKLLSETLQSMWKKELNVSVKLLSMEWKVFLDTLSKNTPSLYRLNWGADYPDPDTFMQLFTTNNQINYGKWSNSEYDSLVRTAASIINTEQRIRLYRRAEEILIEENTAIAPIYINTQTILKNTNVSGLSVNPMDITFLHRVSKF